MKKYPKNLDVFILFALTTAVAADHRPRHRERQTEIRLFGFVAFNRGGAENDLYFGKCPISSAGINSRGQVIKVATPFFFAPSLTTAPKTMAS